jgi:2-polyprenyl-3-methyl-5-hydroxy-6-metoxy-1,4-benzoquinol methylase
MSANDCVRYIREPLKVVNNIPVFSHEDRYTDNYKKIALDHVGAMQKTGQNPFIDEDLWLELEGSTKILIDKYVPDEVNVLDVGVGLGRMLGPITRFNRYGIDISFDYLEIAKTKGIKVAFSKIEDMPFEDNSFDVIICCDVLEHVIDLHACCLQILRVLKPGGILIVRVPYKDNLEAYLDESIPYEYIHLRSFDVPSLRILFSKIHQMSYLEHLMVAPYLKDHLFKVNLLPLESKTRKMVLDAQGPDNPLWILRGICELSHEAYRDWIFGLRETNPNLLDEIMPDVAEALEVNVVFKKSQNSI